jgi:uncharacterized protein (DUF697 family)
MDRHTRTESIISDHVFYSMAGAMIPIPLVDIGAVAAVQLSMIRGLAETYDVKYDQERSKAIVASLVGASLPKIVASVFKVVPGIGTLVGGVAQIILSGAATYALGNVFRTHFEREGHFENFNAEDLSALYHEYFDKGKQVAETIRELLNPSDRRSVPGLAKTLERLERLRESEAISEVEFDRLKRAALDRV